MIQKIKPFLSHADILSDDQQQLQRHFSESQSSQSEEQVESSDCLYKLTESEHQLPPFCSIGVITATYKNIEIRGSASLISPNLVLTAAHNVFNRQYSQSYHNVKFYPAPCGVMNTTLGIATEEIRFPINYCYPNTSNIEQNDYALIKLSKKVEYVKQHLYLQLGVCCQKCFQQNKNQLLCIFGYPFQKSLPNYQPLNKQGSIFKINQYGLQKSGQIIQSQKGLIYHKIPTMTGQSGSPVIYQDKCIGIHIKSMIKDTKKVSQGILFDDQIIQNLIQYSQNMQAIPFSVSKRDDCKHKNPSLIQQSLQVEGLQKRSISIERLMPIQPFMDRLDLTCEQLQNSQQIGHELHPSLKYLYLSENKFRKIDVIKNINLLTLCLNKNQLSSIDISANKNLRYLNLSGNNISSINLSHNERLRILFINDNKLREICTSSNTELSRLALNNNQLQSIDLSRNQNLCVLSLSNNMIQKINLNNLIKLRQLYLSHNSIKCINLLNNIKLKWLFLQNNQIGSINLNSNTELQLLNLQYNNILYLNVRQNTDLQKISVRNNHNLKQLNLQNNVHLSQIYVSINYRQIIVDLTKQNTQLKQPKQFQLTFTSLTKYRLIQDNNQQNRSFQSKLNKNIAEGVSNIILPQHVKVLSSQNTNLKYIDLGDSNQLVILNLPKNMLTDLRLKNCLNLSKLLLQHNQIAEIDLTANIHLKYLNLSNNMLKEIDLFNNISLIQVQMDFNYLKNIQINNSIQLLLLSLSKNRLKEININLNTNLTILYLNSNNLKQINISRNTQLVNVDFSNNQLYEINLSHNQKLTKLYLNENKLNYINLSKNIELAQLQSNGNQLKEINLSNNTKLSILSLNYNNLEEINLSNNKLLTSLDLSFNSLRQINLRQNIDISCLKLNSNSLVQLNLSKNTILQQLQLSYNNLIQIDTSLSPQLRIFQISNNLLTTIRLFFNPNLSLSVESFLFQKTDLCETTLLCSYDDQKQCRSVITNIHQFLQLDSYIEKKKLNQEKTNNLTNYSWKVIPLKK